jgi:hypothetical protein
MYNKGDKVTIVALNCNDSEDYLSLLGKTGEIKDVFSYYVTLDLGDDDDIIFTFDEIKIKIENS